MEFEVLQEYYPYKNEKTVGGWSLNDVMEQVQKNNRLMRQISKLPTQWILRTNEGGMNATHVNGNNEITLRVHKDDDLKLAFRGIAWEVTNALNDSRLRELHEKAESGTISNEDYVYGVCRVEADAQINVEIIMIQKGYIKIPPGSKLDLKYIEKNYEKIADKMAKDILNNGVNGVGEKHKDAYGKQYDQLREVGEEKKQKSLENSDETSP